MLLKALTDLLFPRICCGCGRPACNLFQYFCWDCLASLEIIAEPICRHCGNPAAGAVENHFLCGTCFADLPAFDLARSALRYRGLIQRVLQDFKYNRATWLCHDLCAFLLACRRTHMGHVDFDVITYVPLYPAKERTRTYNQSALLAGALARHIQADRPRALLQRLRPGTTQTHLTAAQRHANVRGVFAVKKKEEVRGRRVLLVDDVMTTGATVHECARALKKSGADKVYVLTLARG